MDFANNQRLHELILGFYNLNEPIGCERYGVSCLTFAREIDSRQGLIRGKHITSH